MRQERPILRVSHQGSTIDITPGQPWYVGIGAACNVRLPVRGPAESWFVIRHAGVWTVRAVDEQTSMWLNGTAIPSDRSVRIGTSPSQELYARRGVAEVTLIITAPSASAPANISSAAPETVLESDSARPPEPEPVLEPVPEPALEPPPEPEPTSAPVLQQVEAPGSEPPDQVGWSTGEVPHGSAPSMPSDTGTPERLSGAAAPDSGRILRRKPAPPVPAEITSVEQFLAVMKERKWPGFMSLSGAAGRGMVLARSITAGSRAVVITPGPDGEPAGAAAGRTIYELLCPSGGRFPAGYLRDEGIVITSNGRVMGWSTVLQRDASVIDAPPPLLGRTLTRDFQPRELSEAELLLLLQAAFERHVPASQP
jgi:hypothetical protein